MPTQLVKAYLGRKSDTPLEIFNSFTMLIFKKMKMKMKKSNTPSILLDFLFSVGPTTEDKQMISKLTKSVRGALTYLGK